MRGHILGVDVRTGDGLLTGEDGQRYRFGPADWADRGEPARGLEVDFESEGGRALSIYPVPGAVAVTRPEFAATPVKASRKDRSRLIAALLAIPFILGPFGLHRFYTGRTASGIVMLLLSITFLGLLISVPWSLVDMIRYLRLSDEEFERRYSR